MDNEPQPAPIVGFQPPPPGPQPSGVRYDAQVLMARGWQPVSITDDVAILEKPVKINHVMHGILTILFCGLWAIPWLIITATAKGQRAIITPNGISYVTTK